MARDEGFERGSLTGEFRGKGVGLELQNDSLHC